MFFAKLDDKAQAVGETAKPKPKAKAKGKGKAKAKGKNGLENSPVLSPVQRLNSCLSEVKTEIQTCRRLILCLNLKRMSKPFIADLNMLTEELSKRYTVMENTIDQVASKEVTLSDEYVDAQCLEVHKLLEEYAEVMETCKWQEKNVIKKRTAALEEKDEEEDIDGEELNEAADESAAVVNPTAALT